MKAKGLIVCCLLILFCLVGCQQEVAKTEPPEITNPPETNPPASPETPEITGCEMVSVLSVQKTITGNGSEGVFIEGINVTLSPYKMGKYEVPQQLFEQVMGFNPSFYTSENNFPVASGEKQGLRPVEKVTWYDAVYFCNELTKLKMTEDDCVYTITGTIKTGNNITSAIVTQDLTKKGYRLPTEAEWEFAARGGDPDAGSWSYEYSGNNGEFFTGIAQIGSGSTCHSDYGWSFCNSQDSEDGKTKTHQVGLKIANTLDLYDMSGNVREWCWDWKADITTGTVANPKGPDTGDMRVMRGGHFDAQTLELLQVTNRDGLLTSIVSIYTGFRLCQSL